AHEIRQPLSAMAGAVKELARLVPLQEDEKHLVTIVSRESERLNHIITDFLNYSREKSYDFQETDVRSLLDETLTLMEKKPEIGSKYKIVRAFGPELVRARIDGAKSRHARGRHANGAPRATSVLAAYRLPRYRDRPGPQTTGQNIRAAPIRIRGRHWPGARHRVSNWSSTQRPDHGCFGERPRCRVHHRTSASCLRKHAFRQDGRQRHRPRDAVHSRC